MSGSPDRGRPSGDHFNGTYVPVEEPSTASLAVIRLHSPSLVLGAPHGAHRANAARRDLVLAQWVCKLVLQLSRFLEDRRSPPFGEPSDNAGDEIVGVSAPAISNPEAREPYRSAQFHELGALPLGDIDGVSLRVEPGPGRRE
jgi:hypothetical protein